MIVFDHVHLAAFLMFSTSARQSSVPKKKLYFGRHVADCAGRIVVSVAPNSGSGCLCSLFCSHLPHCCSCLFLCIGFLRFYCNFSETSPARWWSCSEILLASSYIFIITSKVFQVSVWPPLLGVIFFRARTARKKKRTKKQPDLFKLAAT